MTTRDANGQVIQPTLVPAPTDLASIKQRFMNLVGSAVSELETDSDLTVDKKANAIKTLAAVIPLLEQAELAQQTRIDKKNVKDLTYDELKQLASNVLTQKGAANGSGSSE